MKTNVEKNFEMVKYGVGNILKFYYSKYDDEIRIVVDNIEYLDGTEANEAYNFSFKREECPNFEIDEIVMVKQIIRMAKYEEQFKNNFNCTRGEIEALIGTEEEYYSNPSYVDDVQIGKILEDRKNKIMIYK